jgi:hypothetical protein
MVQELPCRYHCQGEEEPQVRPNGVVVTWSSKSQPVTVISNTESEFYSVSQCVLDCVYLRHIMEILGYKETNPTPIAQDNNEYIFLVKDSDLGCTTG